MHKTLTRKTVNGHEYSLLALPGTNLFRFEIVNTSGSNVERAYHQQQGKNIYGIAHFIEHLGFRAPKDYTTDELMSLVKSQGTYNASTDHDRINYFFETTMSRVALAIRLVCNYALNDLTNIPEEEFVIEKKVVFNEAKRYADDDQTMFYCNMTPALCNYHVEDNVIGTPDTVDTFTHEDAINIKRWFLSTGRQVYNVTYDNTKMSEEEVIAKVEDELARFPVPSRTKEDTQLRDTYHNMLGSPEVGSFVMTNDSEQAMTAVMMDVVDHSGDDIFAARIANNYLGSYSDTSLTDIIREGHGLTYGLHFYDTDISYKSYVAFACDVTRGTEELLMSLFKDSIVDSIDNFDQAAHDNLMEITELKRAMAHVNQKTYTSLHWLSLWHPNIVDRFEDELAVDVDDTFVEMDKGMASHEQLTEYMAKVRTVVITEDYGLVTN